jgi:hypothetical protein
LTTGLVLDQGAPGENEAGFRGKPIENNVLQTKQIEKKEAPATTGVRIYFDCVKTDPERHGWEDGQVKLDGESLRELRIEEQLDLSDLFALAREHLLKL